jgi:CHAT domain-containing protein/Tfp pilus assembly protein PilF
MDGVLRKSSLLAVLGLFCTFPQAAVEPDSALKAAETIYRQDGPEVALPKFEQLAERFKVEKRRQDEATALHFVGECHWRLGNFDDSRAHLDIALTMRRELDDRLGEGKTLNVLGLLEWDIGSYDPAIALFRDASSIAHEIGDRKLEGATLNNLSLVYDELGDYGTSLAQYERVLDIYRGIDFPRGEGDTYSNIGGVYLLLGQYRTALDYYEKSFAISRQLDSKLTLGLDYGNIGLAYLGLGEVDTAIAHFDQAIELAVETGLHYDAAIWQRGKGNAFIRKGRYNDGLKHHRTALATYEDIGAKAELLGALHDMGQLHMSLGDPTSAEQYFRQAIELAREIGHARGITLNLIALGNLYLRREQYDESTSLFSQARHRAAQSGEQPQLAESLLGLAFVHQSQRRFVEALDATHAALAIARDIGARQLEAEALYTLADVARQTGRLEKALESFAEAETILNDTGDPDLLWQIHFGRANTLEALGDKIGAIESLKKSVRLIEGVRSRLREERFRTGYLQDKHQVYVELVRLQLEMDMTEEAFSTAERLRARSYAEQFEKTGLPLLSEDEQLRENELRERIRQLQRAIVEEDAQPKRRQAAVQTFSSELMLAERAYQAFLDEHTQASPLRAIVAPLASSTEVRKQLLRNEVLLEYVVGEDEIMIFALSGEKLIAMIERVRQVDIQSRIELLRDFIRQPGNDRWLKPAQSIAAVLIAPLERAGVLEGVTHIYVVPHGILNYLPFSMLPVHVSDRQRLLLEDHTLAYLPTAVALTERREAKRGPVSLLAVAPARSRLRYAPDEARSINAFFEPNSRLLIGDDATESNFKDLADDFQLLHLATHSDFNKLNPMFSSLQLEPDDANDGRLEVHEVLRLNLDADLVTLSACDTALGTGYFTTVPAGDEFVGLTRAFLSVGSDSVMATLWEVDDRSSVHLMKQFYKRLGDPGASKDKSAALMLAQQQLRSTKAYEHPYYWAPFVLIGKMSKALDARAQVLEATL